METMNCSVEIDHDDVLYSEYLMSLDELPAYIDRHGGVMVSYQVRQHSAPAIAPDPETQGRAAKFRFGPES